MAQQQGTTQLSYIGRGKVFMAPVGESLVHIGNCSQFDLTFNEENATQRDYQTGGGGSAAKLTRVSTVNGAITTFSYNREVLKGVLRATIAESAAAVGYVQTAHIAANQLSPLLLLTKPLDKSVDVEVFNAGADTDKDTQTDVDETANATDPNDPDSFTDTTPADGEPDLLGDGDADSVPDGATPLTLGTDFVIENNSIQLTGSNVQANDLIYIKYNAQAGFCVEPLAQAQQNYRFVFDGLNEANGDKPVLLEIYCAALDLSLIHI